MSAEPTRRGPARASLPGQAAVVGATGRERDRPGFGPQRAIIAPCTTPTAENTFATRAVHAGQEPDELTGAVAPPIYQTSTFAQDGIGRPRRGYEYARTQNPTRQRLERAVAELEGGRHGVAFASGSAATAAIAQLAAADEEILVGDDVYGGTFRYLESVHRPSGAGSARYLDLSAGTDACGRL